MTSARLSLLVLSSIFLGLTFSGCSESDQSSEWSGWIFHIIVGFFFVIALLPSRKPQNASNDSQNKLGSLPSKINTWQNAKQGALAPRPRK